jgi:hypothetical protein
MISSPLTLRRRVVLTPMRSTFPLNSPTWIPSPTTNGLSSRIAIDANKSPSTFCSASATAIPPTPSDAMSDVTFCPTASRHRSRTSDQTMSWPMNPSTVTPIVRAGSSELLPLTSRAIANSTRPRIQNPAWIQNATLRTFWMYVSARAIESRVPSRFVSAPGQMMTCDAK